MRATVGLWLANLVSRGTPRTRAFALRNWLFRQSGVNVHPTAKICGGVTFDNVFADIGAYVWMGGGTRIIGSQTARVSILDACDLGPEVLLVAGTHELGPSSRRAGTGRSEAIVVGPGAWVGARATILAGAAVGRGAVVAAGAVVARSAAPDTLVGGVPARLIRVLAGSANDGATGPSPTCDPVAPELRG